MGDLTEHFGQVKDSKPKVKKPKPRTGKQRAWLIDEEEESKPIPGLNSARFKPPTEEKSKTEVKPKQQKSKTELKLKQNFVNASVPVDELRLKLRMLKGRHKQFMDYLGKNKEGMLLIEDICQDLSISREHVNNLFKVMRAKGYIDFETSYGMKKYEIPERVYTLLHEH